MRAATVVSRNVVMETGQKGNNVLTGLWREQRPYVFSMSTETTDAQCEIGPGSEPGPPERLGRYRILRRIGRGASATVYEALDTRMGRRVAVKVLQIDPDLSAERRTAQVERFDREARVIAHLSHPNIVFVYDVGEDDGRHYLVMELLEGVTLRERLAEGGPIAPDEAMSIVDQMALALDATHAEGIVHRDIKPSNVVMLPDGRVKMLDFGIARSGDDISVTHTGVVIGSPAYMSPEQGRGESVSPASDIWSLGALVYEMLVGRPAFSGPSVVAVLHQIAYDQPPPLRGDIVGAGSVISRAMAKLPDLRYPSAGELAADLHAALGDPVRRYQAGTAGPLEHGAGVAVTAVGSQEHPLTASPGLSSPRRSSRRRLRRLLADLALVMAWAAIGVAVLSILALRLRGGGGVVASLPAMSPSAPDRLTVAPAAPASAARDGATLRAAAALPPSGMVQTLPTASMTPMSAAPHTGTFSATAPKLPRLALPATPLRPRTVAPLARARVVPPPPSATASSRDRRPPVVVALAPVSVARASLPRGPQNAVERRSAPAMNSDATAATDGARFRPDTLLGRWNGNIWKDRATLLVKSSDAGGFSGMAIVSTGAGDAHIPVTGTFSPITGRITFWATAPADASHYDLGQESGRLLAGGLMGGLGLNDGHRLYTWSFSR